MMSRHCLAFDAKHERQRRIEMDANGKDCSIIKEKTNSDENRRTSAFLEI